MQNQCDLRLFEEIGGNVQEKKTKTQLKEENKKIKKALLELSLRELKIVKHFSMNRIFKTLIQL